MTEIEEYYNKFNEEKRLDSRHGQVEYRITMKYIHDALTKLEEEISESDKVCEDIKGRIKILDIGAGTGKYSVALANEGYDVTAVELVKYNLGILRKKGSNVKAMQGNALNLKKLPDSEFDVTLLFGPMYHLFTQEDRCKALSEAKRVTKPGGTILVAYVMNEYSVVTYAFKEKHVLECVNEGRFTESFRTISDTKDLYDYVRIEDINQINEMVGLERIKIISPDGPANYIRPFLNQLSEEEFECFVKYQLAVCERQDLIGAGAHTVDILRR